MKENGFEHENRESTSKICNNNNALREIWARSLSSPELPTFQQDQLRAEGRITSSIDAWRLGPHEEVEGKCSGGLPKFFLLSCAG